MTQGLLAQAVLSVDDQRQQYRVQTPDDRAQANLRLQILAAQVAELTWQAAEICEEHAQFYRPSFEVRAIAAELQWREDHPREADGLELPLEAC